MFGLIGKIRAQPGKRDELIAILLESTEAIAGFDSHVKTMPHGGVGLRS